MTSPSARLAALLVLLAGPLASPLVAQQPCFSGAGGPGGNFDWVVRQGEFFIFDTTATPILGGPGGLPTNVQNTVGGLVDVRNLIVEPGGTIRVQGPNPMRIQATGEVVVRGTIDLSGFNARDVATLNTGNQIEIGAAGVAGGGAGGNGNVNTSGHSLRGGTGRGAFNQADAGAQGGESGHAPVGHGKDARRPGGGGGARLARDQGPGLEASAGNAGHPLGTGAESGLSPALGGLPNAGVFVDAKPENDFWGVRPVIGGRGSLVGLVRGELPTLWAGAGGGAGGNAIPTLGSFPNPFWNIASDEKGGAGGGGAGGLHVQALGRIVFGALGQVLANGGRGGTGENTNFLDHVGGTGGAGSGGHVVLESASEIDFTDGGANTGVLPRDWIRAVGVGLRTGPLGDVNACCRTLSNGGASGPGVVQLHVPNPVQQPGTNPATTDIVVPLAVAQHRFPLAQIAAPGAVAAFPTCNPFPRGLHAWFGSAGQGARASLLGLALAARDARELLLPESAELELGSLEIPRRP